MPEMSFAIRLNNVTKAYRLFGNQRQQLMEVLGLHRLGMGKASQYREFAALNGVTLDVSKGSRIGVVGRNGAGKTTLLKLICGNFMPTSGIIEVNGAVQALMGTGLGFHPEYTGRDNARASLQYNGLNRKEYESALEDIFDFCELGDFIDQPFKTYSLGMQARLMFATATAVRPDILIVDEVLGAGDAYFIAKSRRRMENLVSGGCTMLLVSHSTQQVLEMCERAVWLDQGTVRMEGDAFSVIRAYEEHVHGAAKLYQSTPRAMAIDEFKSINQPVPTTGKRLLQEPAFVPHIHAPDFPASAIDVFQFVAGGGLSRWESEVGLKICGFDIQRPSGSTNVLVSMEPARIVISLIAEESGRYSCRYGIVIHDFQGRCVTRIYSPEDNFDIEAGQYRQLYITFNPLQLGPGDYTLGISILEFGPLAQVDTARRFDLLGRSFAFKIELPNSLAATTCNIYHSAEWGWNS